MRHDPQTLSPTDPMRDWAEHADRAALGGGGAAGPDAGDTARRPDRPSGEPEGLLVELVRTMLERMPWPAAIIGPGPAVWMGNRIAQGCAALRALPAYGRTCGTAGAPPPTVDPALPRALRRLLVQPDAAPAAVRLSMPDRASPVCVVLQPVPGLGGPGPWVLATVHDARAPYRVDRSLLTGLLGLTPAEARVAARLAEGLTPDEVADESGTSVQTVRTQVQSVFAKLSLNRQAMLIKTLLTMPPGISFPPDAPVRP